MNRRIDLYFRYANENGKIGVDQLMNHLSKDITLRETKMIDYCLGLMNSSSAIEQVIEYLFHGTKMQRNYSTLFLARKNIWDPINRAYKLDLIDYKQAYSR